MPQRRSPDCTQGGGQAADPDYNGFAIYRCVETGISGRGCQGVSHDEHKKRLALDQFQPEMFLAVAAGGDWRLFDVEERVGRVVLGRRRDLDCLYFNR
jgi:hypothetical protein